MTAMRCVRIGCFVFVKYLQYGRTKHTHWELYSDALLSRWMLCFFVNYLQDGFTQTHALRPLQRRVAFGLDALFFVNYLQDVTKTHALRSLHRCATRIVGCFVFCKLFARCYKNPRIEVVTAMRCSLDGFFVFCKIFASHKWRFVPRRGDLPTPGLIRTYVHLGLIMFNSTTFQAAYYRSPTYGASHLVREAGQHATRPQSVRPSPIQPTGMHAGRQASCRACGRKSRNAAIGEYSSTIWGTLSGPRRASDATPCVAYR